MVMHSPLDPASPRLDSRPNDMLSSLFPRNSIYKSLDETDHGHAFDAGNAALFSTDELDEHVGDVDHLDQPSDSAGVARSRRGHTSQPSLPDPFERMPKTGTVSQLPLTCSAPPSPPSLASAEVHDRNTTRVREDSSAVTATSAIDPFKSHEVFSNEPMSGLSERLGSPYSISRHDAATEHRDLQEQAHIAEETGPPKSIMFGVPGGVVDTFNGESYDHYRRPSAISPRRGYESTAQPHLASSSHISGAKSQLPWWLRENRRRLGDLAEASSSQSIGIQTQEVPNTTIPGIKSANAESPATHTMFLPTHASRSTQGRSPSSTPSKVRRFVQDVYNVGRGFASAEGGRRQGPIHLQTHLSKKDKALWNWVNVDDLDEFLQEVYTFYVRKGIWSIALAGFLDLLTIGFVIAFSIFLLGCVDYSVIRNSHTLAAVVVPRCVSRFHGGTLCLFLSMALFYALRIFKFGQIVKRLFVMRDFFTELLDVPESDIQTVPWPVIVEKISALRSEHPAVSPHGDFTELHVGEELPPKPPSSNKPRLDAHDVANRIMRKENYFIALFNKNVLNTAIPIPLFLARSRSFDFICQKMGLVTTVIVTGEGSTISPPRGADNASAGLLTKVLEWNLKFCLLGFLFGADGQVRRQFVSERNKKELVAALQRRFILMGCINAVFAPFIVLYLLFYSFFRYFEEYHKNPSSLGMRSYTQLARWKFREFNELPHIFQMRLHRSYPLAEAYVSQFPNDRMAQLARFVAFISGSFASVLVLFSLVDPDAFLHFEITPDRTVLFYIGIFGSLMAIARGMVPDDHRVVDPEALMRDVIEETHYMPVHWRNKLHSADVHREFSLLFPLKIVSFFHEILSVLTTPLVLWFTLPRSSARIIDFFREFTIHVDGLGYVCSFAVFDFTRTGLGDVRYGAPAPVVGAHESSADGRAGQSHSQVQSRSDSVVTGEMHDDEESQDGRPRILIDERLVADQGKLEKSIIGFKAAHPTWQPQDPSTSLYLSRITDLASNSMSLPPLQSTKREFGQHGAHHRGAGTSSRSAVRRTRLPNPLSHAQQHSPFTSPILEDEDGPSGSLIVGQNAAGMTTSILDTGRHSGSYVFRRTPNAPDGVSAHDHLQQQPRQQYRHRYPLQHGGLHHAAPAIEEEGDMESATAEIGAGQEDDVDPYIRPDESRQMVA